ncbi:MAG: helix-turn-helix transcriptional regulator, partial [Lachnospiraceae bacterium]|nr:helix-turn-helix transcriptional regulator [Lachnospiraceae bacterium]
LRRQLDYRQIKMAEALGVDVKKLRDLENGKRLPDAELLFRLYQKYNVSPCVMLRDKNGMIAEIAGILERMDNREKALLTDFFMNILNVRREKDVQ